MADPLPPNTSDKPPILDEEVAATLRELGQSWSTIPRARVETGSSFVDPDLDVTETRGSRPNERYVRVVRSRKQGFEHVAPGWIQATPRTTLPTGGFAKVRRHLRTAVLGTPLATRQLTHERLTNIKALAVLSSDALSSVAYATEQIVFVLAIAGTAALGFDLPIMAVIAFLLAAVVLSYRQTIKAYPQGGGSYIVAKDNLGPLAGLIAAAALMTDYILTVAVSVASGYDQIQSAFPGAAPYRVVACVSMIVLIALGNLRGLRESGSIFAAPTYLFIAAMFLAMGVTFFRLISGDLHGGASTIHLSTTQLGTSLGNLGGLALVLLLLRAFSSGCSAMTGVEAISDGILAFRPPEWRNARITLTVMGALLAVMFIGITVANHILGADLRDSADPCYQSVIAQLAAHAFTGPVACVGGHAAVPVASVLGQGLFLFTIVATTAILILAANTSFSDFPRLFFFLARDDFAPHQFRRLGDRLAFSNGIIVLTVMSSLLLVIFHGDVSKLIPLYAIGVFLAFTMSQAGMVVRWLRRREPGWRRGLPLNAVGMVMTFVVFLVTAFSKLPESLIILVIIPALVSLFFSIHRHYSEVQSETTTEIPTTPATLKPVCIVPIADLNGVSLQSLSMARTISDAVIAVHICDDPQHIALLREKWEAWGNHVPLEIVESPYRSFLQPLLAYIEAIDQQRHDDTLVIILPELVATSWWHQLLHNQTALRLKAALLFRPGTVVINVPYHLEKPRGRRQRRRDNIEAI